MYILQTVAVFPAMEAVVILFCIGLCCLATQNFLGLAHVFQGIVGFVMAYLGNALLFQRRISARGTHRSIHSSTACPCQEAIRGFAGFESPYFIWAALGGPSESV